MAMANKEVTRNELLALRASVQVMLEQIERMLTKMDDKQPRRNGLSEQAKAELWAGRMKTFMRAKDRKEKAGA